MIPNTARILLLAMCVGVAAGTLPLSAQVPVRCDAPLVDLPEAGMPRDAISDLARVAELAGAARPKDRVIDRGSDPQSERFCASSSPVRVPGLKTDTLGEGIRPTPWRLFTFYNSAYADDRNDGLVWAGRGVSGSLTGGVHLKQGIFSAQLSPVVAWQENRPFAIVPPPANFSPYAYERPGRSAVRIDWPQRFGPDSYWSFSPGYSFARVDVAGIGAGVSSENFWWGPGRENSILMTTTAAGFPHAFLKTSHPANVGIGHLEAEAVWGRLSESDYYNSNPADDHRLFTGLVLAFSPKGAPGLSLGVARVFHRIIPPEALAFSDYVPFFRANFKKDLITPDNPDGLDQTDQLAAFFFRWSLPAAGVEMFGEWAQNDHTQDFKDLISEPDHASGHALGLQKVFGDSLRWYRAHAEVISLGVSPSILHRTSGSFYVNFASYQGYTQRGQLLGAAIGPGGDMQSVGFDAFRRWGWAGGFLERRRKDVDAYYSLIGKQSTAGGGSTSNHDAEFGGGLRGVLMRPRFGVDWEVAYGRRYHKYFTDEVDENARVNLGLELFP